eukprot:sb/3478948/
MTILAVNFYFVYNERESVLSSDIPLLTEKCRIFPNPTILVSPQTNNSVPRSSYTPIAFCDVSNVFPDDTFDLHPPVKSVRLFLCFKRVGNGVAVVLP